jgi:hypothetical protein
MKEEHMWQVVYIANSQPEADRIIQALEKEFISPRTSSMGRMVQIMVTESEVDDAAEIIREFLAGRE